MSLDNTPGRQSPVQHRLTSFGGRTALLVVAVGLLIIGLGYNGISGASINGFIDLRAQLPYLVSGGILGLALVIVGAALMITQSAREDRIRLEAKLDQLIEVQGDGAVRTSAAAPSTVQGLFAAGAASYHRPECRLVDGREETTYVTAEEARAQALNPCRVCQPAASPTNVTLR
jgi:hypothetical protein